MHFEQFYWFSCRRNSFKIGIFSVVWAQKASRLKSRDTDFDVIQILDFPREAVEFTRSGK